MSTAPRSVVDHSRHSAYSDPGAHSGRLSDLPTDPAALSAIARNVIAHYRAEADGLPESSNDDIDLRWIGRMLAVDEHRNGEPLDHPRRHADKLQGCCRDHTLLCVAALRTAGIAARSRIGFAGYFVSGWHHDHVVVEAWLGGRWRRFDPEVAAPMPGIEDPTDLPTVAVSEPGFVTAAQAWRGARAGLVDPESYGVDPSVPDLRGERFLFEEVVHEVAHRFGDELLLWDIWGRMRPPGEPVAATDRRWADEIADLLVRSDDGDVGAEEDLLERYRTDPDLRPGPVILSASPRGGEPVSVRLR